MLVAADESTAFRFATDDVAPADRLAFYRALFDEKLVKFEANALDEAFGCDVRFRTLDSNSTTVLRVESTPVRVKWMSASADGDVVILALFGRGKGTVSQCGRELVAKNGGAIVLSGNDPLEMRRTGYVYLSLPKHALAPLVPDVNAALLTSVAADAEALRYLEGYVDMLTGDTRTMPAALQRAAAVHLQDLAALAIGSTSEGAEIARRRGLRAARLRAIQADIVRNLGSGDIRPTALAARHGVTVRYVHKLFEGEGVTLSRFVLGMRLAHVHRVLSDPRSVDSAIGAIAYDAGFSDLSTFNREFRRRYGATPSDIRAAATRFPGDCVRRPSGTQ